MKITVDTNGDSHEDIKKVIKLLNHLIEENAAASQSYANERAYLHEDQQPEPEMQPEQPSGNLFGMFNQQSEQDTDEYKIQKEPEPEYSQTQSPEPVLREEQFNVDSYIEEKKKDDDDSRIVPYS